MTTDASNKCNQSNNDGAQPLPALYGAARVLHASGAVLLKLFQNKKKKKIKSARGCELIHIMCDSPKVSEFTFKALKT